MNTPAAAMPETTVSPAETEGPSWAGRIYGLSLGEGRLTSMEGLRGLAVLLVFCVHFDALFGQYARQAPALWRSSRFLGIIGNAGVDLFFVLSGYLIYGALLRQTKTLTGFLRRRVERIYPTFLTVFALYLILSFLFPEENKLRGLTLPESISYVAQNLLLLPGVFDIKPLITVAWSLSYEFCFYLGAALLLWLTRMALWSAIYRVGFFAIVMGGYLALSFASSRSFVRGLMFVAGILLYEALSSQRFRSVLNTRGEVVSIVLLLASFVFAWLLNAREDIFSSLPGWRTGRNATPDIPVYQGPYKTGAMIVSMFWFAAYAFGFDGRISRLFRWAPIRCLGNMSYSYYLIHGVTLQAVALVWVFLSSRGTPGIPLFLGGLMVSFVATWINSTVLFVLVEKPYSLQKKRSRGHSATPVTEPPHA